MTVDLTPARAVELTHWWDITNDPLNTWSRQQKQARFIQPTRASKTHALGRKVCGFVRQRIEARGLAVNETTHKKSFDLWIQDVMHVEVKAANWTRRSAGRGRFQAHLGKTQVKDSDLIIMGCKNGDWHYFVIPADRVTGPTIEITSYDVEDYTGQYAPYLEAWHLLETTLASAARNRPRQLPLPLEGN